MPEIEKEKLNAMLADVPTEKRDAFLADFKKRGYTIKASGLPKSSSGQNIYPPSPEIGNGAAAWQATKEALSTPVPGLDQAGKFASETAPNYIAEKTGAMGESIGGRTGALIKGAGVLGAGTLGTAGEMIPRTVGDVAAQAIGGPLLEGTGVLAKKSIKSIPEVFGKAGDVATALLARDIGVAEPFIENVKRNPAALKDLSNDMSVVMAHAQTMSDVMKRGVDRLGDHIKAVEDQFIDIATQNNTDLRRIHIGDVLDNFMGKVKNRGTEGIKDSLSDYSSITGKEADTIRKYVGRLKNMSTSKGQIGVVSPGGEKGVNAIDLLRLKRELKTDIAWDKADATAKQIGDVSNGLLKNLYGEVQKKIDNLSPELREAEKEYSRARKQYDVLQRKVFGGSPEEAYNRVKLRIQRGVAPQALIERAAQINSSSEKAMRALIDKVSAQQFAPLVRKGIAGGFLGVGAGAAMAGAMGGHGLYPLIADLAAAAASSPRLASFGIRGAEASKGAISALVAKAASTGSTDPMVLRALAQTISSGMRDQKDAQP